MVPIYLISSHHQRQHSHLTKYQQPYNSIESYTLQSYLKGIEKEMKKSEKNVVFLFFSIWLESVKEGIFGGPRFNEIFGERG